ncbi:hypothetical protein M9H77_23346 [Catharanthus roseus]|uniref:Uncharacterized protein n=1 Tax=Catharanthus roseus TaxID=4058 RepID=A0ACC0AVZ5_CATRO|nr:hypothetical protein M9H77_23346 [Catharanthus roseus]
MELKTMKDEDKVKQRLHSWNHQLLKNLHRSKNFNMLQLNLKRIDEYHFNIANYDSCVLGVEDKETSKEEELESILKDLSISLSLNPSLSFHEVSFEELESLLVSYTFHVSIFVDICVISLDENDFPLMPCMTKCLSSHISLKDPLMSSCTKFDPSCYNFGVLDDTSPADPNIVGFELDYAFLNILHDECFGKVYRGCWLYNSFPWCLHEES